MPNEKLYFFKKNFIKFLIEIFETKILIICLFYVLFLSNHCRSSHVPDILKNRMATIDLELVFEQAYLESFLLSNANGNVFFNCPIVIKPNDILFSMLSLLLKCFNFSMQMWHSKIIKF